MSPPLTTVLGIDPGVSGALALVSHKKVITHLDLALTRRTSQVAPRQRVISPSERPVEGGTILDPAPIASFLDGIDRDGLVRPKAIVMEDVSVMGGHEGRVAMFRFGETKGLLTGLLWSYFPDIPHLFLKPNVWKPAMGLTRNKRLSIDLAQKTWPDDVALFRRVKDADRAEAALLGLCGLKIVRQ